MSLMKDKNKKTLPQLDTEETYKWNFVYKMQKQNLEYFALMLNKQKPDDL